MWNAIRNGRGGRGGWDTHHVVGISPSPGASGFEMQQYDTAQPLCVRGVKNDAARTILGYILESFLVVLARC